MVVLVRYGEMCYVFRLRGTWYVGGTVCKERRELKSSKWNGMDFHVCLGLSGGLLQLDYWILGYSSYRILSCNYDHPRLWKVYLAVYST